MVESTSADGQRILCSINDRVDTEAFRKLHWEGTFDEYLSMLPAMAGLHVPHFNVSTT